MSSATNSTGPTKQVRFSSQGKTPSEITHDKVSLAVASLPESMKQWAEHWCAKINTAHAKWCRHKTTLTKLTANPEFIPRSARINFSVTGSRLANEHEEFKLLTAEVDKFTAKVQMKYKQYITKAAKLENSILEVEFATTLSHACITFTQLNLLAITGKQPPADDINYLVNLALADHIDRYIQRLDEEKFSALYTEITGFPFVLSNNDLQSVTPAVKLFRFQFLDRCRNLFIVPIEAFTEAETANSVSAIVTQFATGLINGSTTATTALALDDEPTVPSAQMESLINKAVKKSTDTLRAQIKDLKASAKNSTRGAPATSASLKKKKSQQQETTEEAPKKKKKKTSAAAVAPKAAAANNATPGNNARSTKNNGRGKSNRKNTPKTGDNRSKKN